jgi:hypothetical protein
VYKENSNLVGDSQLRPARSRQSVAAKRTFHAKKKDTNYSAKDTFSIPADLLSDSNLKYRAECAYMVMRTFANHDTGECWPTLETIAKLMGYGLNAKGKQKGIRQVQQDINALRLAGWIQVKRRFNNSNLYTLKLAVDAAVDAASERYPTASKEALSIFAKGRARFAMVPKALIFARNLHYSTKVEIAARLLFQRNDAGAWASDAEVRAKSGISDRHLRNTRKESERLGWLDRDASIEVIDQLRAVTGFRGKRTWRINPVGNKTEAKRKWSGQNDHLPSAQNCLPAKWSGKNDHLLAAKTISYLASKAAKTITLTESGSENGSIERKQEFSTENSTSPSFSNSSVESSAKPDRQGEPAFTEETPKQHSTPALDHREEAAMLSLKPREGGYAGSSPKCVMCGAPENHATNTCPWSSNQIVVERPRPADAVDVNSHSADIEEEHHFDEDHENCNDDFDEDRKSCMDCREKGSNGLPRNWCGNHVPQP